MRKKFEFTPEDVFKPKRGDIITRKDAENGVEFYVSEATDTCSWIARLQNPFGVIQIYPEEYQDFKKVSEIKTR